VVSLRFACLEASSRAEAVGIEIVNVCW
jgi:hypothetical protein